jgi:hypothetical protein
MNNYVRIKFETDSRLNIKAGHFLRVKFHKKLGGELGD